MVLHGLSLGLEFYFKDIQVMGREIIKSLPKERPLIFAANHPNSLMDSVILATQVERKLCYLARSGLFKNPVMSKLFRQMGAIPVYRAQDDPSKMGGNLNTFAQAWEVLESGGAIGVFPEGQNAPERQVMRIKTGIARIALGAEAKHGYGLGCQIIPVGLNFEDRDKFMSSVLVSFGQPIDVSEFASQHKDDERAAVRALTERVQTALREEAMHIDDDLLRQLTRDVHKVYGHHLLKEWFGERRLAEKSVVKTFFDVLQSNNPKRTGVGEHFWVKRKLHEMLSFYHEEDPRVLEELRRELRRYDQHLEHSRMRHELLERSPQSLSLRWEAVGITLYAILFAPLALTGLLINCLPYLVVSLLARRAPDEAIRTITAFGVGLLAFPAVYCSLLWVIWLLTGSVVWLLVSSFMMPASGFFFLRYQRRLVQSQDKILVRTMFRTNRILLRVLSQDRDRLLDRLEGLRHRYVQETGAQ